MSNLRQLAVKDLKSQNLKDWSLPVILIDPDVNTIDTDNETGEPLKAVQILYDYRKIDPNTGEEKTVHEPIITIMRSSLPRIPLPGENWMIRFPIDPENPDTLSDNYILSGDRSPEGGQSLGYIRLYPLRAAQR